MYRSPEVADFDKAQWITDLDRFRAAKKSLRLAQKEFDEVKKKLDSGKAKKMVYEYAMISIASGALKQNQDLIAHGQLILNRSSMAKPSAKAQSTVPKRRKSWERDTSSDEE